MRCTANILSLAILLASASLARCFSRPPVALTRSFAAQGSRRYAAAETLPSLVVATDAATSLVESFRDTFRDTLPLQGVLVIVASRLVVRELRYRIERPVMGKVAGKVAEQLRPTITKEAWIKLALCIVLDLVGDASELVPVIGELSDIPWAGADFLLLRLLFQSNSIAGFGFVEEILPFTDIIPTFTIAWCLEELWPTTKLARFLGVGKEVPESEPEADKKTSSGSVDGGGEDLLRRFDEKASKR